MVASGTLSKTSSCISLHGVILFSNCTYSSNDCGWAAKQGADVSACTAKACEITHRVDYSNSNNHHHGRKRSNIKKVHIIFLTSEGQKTTNICCLCPSLPPELTTPKEKEKSEIYVGSNSNRKLRELKKKWKNTLKGNFRLSNEFFKYIKSKILSRTMPDYKLFKGLLRSERALAQKFKDFFVQTFN